MSRACRPVPLNRKELGVLEELLIADGGVRSAEDLFERVWDESTDLFSRTVTVTIARLRRKLGEPDLIETVIGIGTGCHEVSPGLAVRRVWPQKVRTRLTLLYAVLFLGGRVSAAGHHLRARGAAASPDRPAVVSRPRTGTRGRKFETACRAAPAPDPGTVLLCKQAFSAGSQRGPARASASAPCITCCSSRLAGLGAMTAAPRGPRAGRCPAGCCGRSAVITETARRASEQHLGERLAPCACLKDELRELADTFDDMLERLDAAFVSQRRFVANASHELRTPLTVMRTAIDVTPGQAIAARRSTWRTWPHPRPGRRRAAPRA